MGVNVIFRLEFAVGVVDPGVGVVVAPVSLYPLRWGFASTSSSGSSNLLGSQLRGLGKT